MCLLSWFFCAIVNATWTPRYLNFFRKMNYYLLFYCRCEWCPFLLWRIKRKQARVNLRRMCLSAASLELVKRRTRRRSSRTSRKWQLQAPRKTLPKKRTKSKRLDVLCRQYSVAVAYLKCKSQVAQRKQHQNTHINYRSSYCQYCVIWYQPVCYLPSYLADERLSIANAGWHSCAFLHSRLFVSIWQWQHSTAQC